MSGLTSPAAFAGDPSATGEIYSPFERTTTETSIKLDMKKIVLTERGQHVAQPLPQPDLSTLPAVAEEYTVPPPYPEDHESELPPEYVQIGEVVQLRAVAEGTKDISVDPSPAFNEKPGNEYPRKHTVFLNFNGGKMLKGADNSAINKSTLARHNEVYPGYGGTEQSALATIQAVQGDLEPLGIRVKYADRPNDTVPYTMCLVGGSWTDTTIDSPAGGVAPGTDCESRNQRNVVYAFGQSSSSTISQELAHAWGLDHLYGFDMIMSYQGGGNKNFASECRDLCEEGCQGPGSIGCRLTHEIYCGEDSEQQYDYEELEYIFGTNEPDMVPPEVAITEPADGLQLESGASIAVIGDITDNYGGFGWRLMIEQNGELVFDEVDYDRLLKWELMGLPDGEYIITLEAEDHADHIVQDRVTINVGGEPGGTGDETSGETSETNGTSDTSNPTGGVETDSGGETLDTLGGTETDGTTDGMKDGCGCTSDADSNGWSGATIALFGGLLLFRRRRDRV